MHGREGRREGGRGGKREGEREGGREGGMEEGKEGRREEGEKKKRESDGFKMSNKVKITSEEGTMHTFNRYIHQT